MTTYFISDLHFDHKQVMKYDNRPFSSTKEMDEAMIKNWNNTVLPTDDIYIIGDMFNERSKFDYIEHILQSLKGQLHYIVGNHDHQLIKNPEFTKYFASIDQYKTLNLNTRNNESINVVLTHYPLTTTEYAFVNTPSIQLYGHVHNSFEEDNVNLLKLMTANSDSKQFIPLNVGVMMPYMNYRPQTLESLLAVSQTFEYEYKKQFNENNDIIEQLKTLAHKLNTGRD